MKVPALIVGVLLLFTAVASATSPSNPSNLWPAPASFASGQTQLTVTPAAGAVFFTMEKAVPFLSAAFERYAEIMFPHQVAAGFASRRFSGGAALVGVSVSVDDDDDSHPQVTTDESYTLTISDDGSKPSSLHAATVYGVLRGLETLSQLVSFDYDTEEYYLANAPWTIKDSPRFPHRGLMIDTARHWQPIPSIMAIVNSLPYAKINVLHWHMVDDQSFPFRSNTYPKLTQGAYSAAERYTQADIAAVVEYARLRGVRVIVEFDMPGHASSWCAGYPEVCPSTTCKGPLNVANNFTFDLISGLLLECTGGKTSQPQHPSGLFPDNFIHLGGDEVDTTCWTTTPSVASWLAANNFTADQGYAYFVHRAAAIAIAQGRRPMQWDEVFAHFQGSLAKETIVHIWRSKDILSQVVQLGYQTVINVDGGDDSWYLDNLGVTWSGAYGNEPCYNITTEQCALVLGGHGEMWGETVDTSDIEQTVWPKLAAIAERLWSPAATTQDVAAAIPRILNFRCLLNQRGVRAAPPSNPTARSAPSGPGSCFSQ
eukprot:gnl/Spiro4/8997_TR4745_c0_g1_i1.p1 gnl/Spiro4/8997_TR4745_c0_g1~~gnl/Spiro4/8997_TR4745_c0_g1_i1.p1  ORF type:complete len:558 (+),score=137.24 gnl/Spiro4/8997_TR4745_c0_g1_i1:54-1676(+)